MMDGNMMHDLMGGGMMWGMGLIGLLILVGSCSSSRPLLNTS
jgi:hypothetical protein